MKPYRMGSEEILKAVNQFPFFIFFNPRESKSELNKKQRRVQPEAAQAQSGFRVSEVVQRDEGPSLKSLDSAENLMP